ncbi:hypothetical protein BB561_005280 [Smittium simulii]|uniref:Integrase zinc-binding domain-containing protein n=1 Tax=Smittium simulii TaxID=133385 RepID=A0A2T9YB90_9FUNG|nr:hypothetical protein BB561_005280 [Smittium simulii]
MTDSTINVSAAHIIGAEERYAKMITLNEEYKTQLTAADSQYNQLAAKLDAIKKHNKDLRDQNSDLKTQLDNETRAKTEMYMQYQQEKIDILTREKNLAEKEADLYRRQSELATCPISTSSISPVSTSTIPKVPDGLTNALSTDFTENKTEEYSVHLPITRSQGPPTKTARRMSKLGEISEIENEYSPESEYSEETELIENQDNYNPDVHSDMPSSSLESGIKIFDLNLKQFLPRATTIIKLQQNDPKLKQILKAILEPETCLPRIIKQSKSYSIIESKLFNTSISSNPRLYVPEALAQAIIYHHYDTPMMSHVGHRRTLDKIQKYLFWPKMSRDIDATAVPSPTAQSTIEALEKRLIVPHGSLNKIIKAFTAEDQSTWDKHLDMHILAYLLAYERLLDAKLSPIRQTIKHNNQAAKDAMTERYNRRHRAVTYDIGSWVLAKLVKTDYINETLGLSTNYIEPYQVVKKIERVSYQLIKINEDGFRSKITAHISRLKPFHNRTTEDAMWMEGNFTIKHQA